MEQEQSKRIDDIINSLDGAARAAASPYFYSKLRNRMEGSIIPRPIAWRLVTALAVVAILNIITIRAVHTSQPAPDTNAQTLASDYSLTLPQTY